MKEKSEGNCNLQIQETHILNSGWSLGQLVGLGPSLGHGADTCAVRAAGVGAVAHVHTWTSRRFAESINQCLAALLSSGPRLGPVPECHSRHYQPCDRQRHAACNVNGTRCNGAMQCAWRAKWGGAAGLYTGLPSQSPHDEKLLKTHPYTRARLFWTVPIC